MCEPDGPWLGDVCGAARSVKREAGRLARSHRPDQLHHRPAGTPRRRTPGGSITKALDDPRDPFAVEVLAGDDDNAATAEIEGRGKNTAVPERHHWLVPRRDDSVVVLQSLDVEPQRVTEHVDQRIPEAGDERHLRALPYGRAPVAHANSQRPTTNFRSH
jgi:hypothetical protein